MKKLTEAVVVSAIENDNTLTPSQRHQALSVLQGKGAPRRAVLLRQSDVCEVLNISRQSVWRLTREGKLHRVAVGTALRYKTEEVLALAGLRGQSLDAITP